MPAGMNGRLWRSEAPVSGLSATFATLKAQGRTGLVTYVTAGDPDLTRSGAILEALDRAGADVLEVGVPFSDPVADGPVIQRAAERAIANGTTLSRVLDLVAGVRRQVRAPVVLFTYVNPLLRMGLDAFADRAADAGLDGVLVLDLPVEEAHEFRNAMDGRGIDTIFLLSPTTTKERIQNAARMGRGFLYGISRLGVTGARDAIASGARQFVARVRQETTLPIAVGFGISTPEQVREVGEFADAAVVGSGLVSVISEAGTASDLVHRVESYVHWLHGGTWNEAYDNRRTPPPDRSAR
jgi:tryptophan synthase alpha chain